MDYEKKYNEALKWMRELYPGLHGATKEDAEHYFPELRESEDERIRKILIEVVNITPASIAVRNKRELLAWLEKQKEQKTAWSEEDEKMLADTIFKLAGFMGNEKNIDWLKSLCPQSSWKPSEEQMEALARATNRCVSVKDANTLLGLLNQIKNL